MAHEIRFHSWESPSGMDVRPRAPMFRVEEGESRFFVWVLLSRTSLAMLMAALGIDDEGTELDRALLRFGVRRIEEGLRDGTLPPEDTSSAHQIRIAESDLRRIAELAHNKSCTYQIADGRDLYCSAAAASDTTVTTLI